MIALRRGAAGVELVLLPLIGGGEDALFGGHTFLEFIEAYASGSIWTHEREKRREPK